MKKPAAFLLTVLVLFSLLLSCGSTGSDETENEPTNADTTITDDIDSLEDERLSPADTAQLTLGDWELSMSYGSPSVRDREVWGSLVPYDRVWRTGANEATNFYTNMEVEILGNTLPAGRYGFFTIPGKDSWTIIFNRVWNQWGAYEYNENEDVFRIVVKPEQLNTFSERLVFDLKPKSDTQAIIHFYWEKLHFTIPIERSE